MSNMTYSFDFKRGIMVFQAKRAIEIGEELTVTYMTLAHDQLGVLAQGYGFFCRCGGHPDYTAEEYERWKEPRYDQFWT